MGLWNTWHRVFENIFCYAIFQIKLWVIVPWTFMYSLCHLDGIFCYVFLLYIFKICGLKFISIEDWLNKTYAYVRVLCSYLKITKNFHLGWKFSIRIWNHMYNRITISLKNNYMQIYAKKQMKYKWNILYQWLVIFGWWVISFLFSSLYFYVFSKNTFLFLHVINMVVLQCL